MKILYNYFFNCDLRKVAKENHPFVYTIFTFHYFNLLPELMYETTKIIYFYRYYVTHIVHCF